MKKLIMVICLISLVGCDIGKYKGELVVEQVPLMICLDPCMDSMLRQLAPNAKQVLGGADVATYYQAQADVLTRAGEYCATFYETGCWKASGGSYSEQVDAVYASHIYGHNTITGLLMETLPK